MLTVDISLHSGSANSQIEDSNSTAIGNPIALSVTPQRLSLDQGQSLVVSNNGVDIYRVLIVHSGTADSGTFEIDSDQGKYRLLPAVAARLGNSVVVETASKVIISDTKPPVSG